MVCLFFDGPKEGLKVLMRAQPHAQITPEIRRELFSARSRGDPYAVGDAEGMAMAMVD